MRSLFQFMSCRRVVFVGFVVVVVVVVEDESCSLLVVTVGIVSSA
jgi:hypothetical protein